MFPTRSLLSHVDCPEHRTDACHRPSCPFTHRARTKLQDESEEEQASEETAGPSSRKRKASPSAVGHRENVPARKAASEEISHLLAAISGGARNSHAARKQQQGTLSATGRAASGPSRASASSSPATAKTATVVAPHPVPPKSAVAGPSATVPTLPSQLVAPSIPRGSHPGVSPVPYTSRQTSLRTLFSTFHTLYSSLASRSPEAASSQSERRVHDILKRLAHHYASQDSQASETKIFKNSNVNFLAYRNSIRTCLVGLSRRQKIEKESEDKGSEVCICMLGIRASEAAIRVDTCLTSKNLAEEERVKKMEEAVRNVLSESDLIGTSDEVEQKKKESEERRKGRLDRERLESADLLIDRAVLASVGYPCPDLGGAQGDLQAAIDANWGPGGRQHDLEGTTVDCERCGVPFKVSALRPDDNDEREACSFHWGKKRFVREANVAKGPRLPRWTCCDALDEATTFASNSLSQIASSAGLVESSNGQASPVQGCARGPHVFKEESTESLHMREGFLSTEQVCRDVAEDDRVKEQYDVLAFDCELVYTTAGMSLARLTVLDEAGRVTLDQYVRPRAAILDYNTRYSGIKEEDFAPGKPVVDLEEARRRMVTMMNPHTILVGHGLENDLKALRLVHLQVVDSALIYRHHKGLPFRFGLRDLTLRHLGKHIQDGDATHGHDPEEDARAALDLIRLKYRASASAQGNAPAAPATSSSLPATTPSPAAPPGPPRPSVYSAPSRPAPPSGPSAAATASLFMKKREPVRRKAK